MINKRTKKTLILQGLYDSSRASVTIECNKFGSTCCISGTLEDLDFGEYIFAIKSNEQASSFVLGMSGRISAKFGISDSLATADIIHCVLFMRTENAQDKPYLYGTNSDKKLWIGNMLDGVKVEGNNNTKLARPKHYEHYNTQVGYEEQDLSILKDNIETQEAQFLKDKADDENFNKLLQILSSTTKYEDSAIASVNYYDLYNQESNIDKIELQDNMQDQTYDNGIANMQDTVDGKISSINNELNKEERIMQAMQEVASATEKRITIDPLLKHGVGYESHNTVYESHNTIDRQQYNHYQDNQSNNQSNNQLIDMPQLLERQYFSSKDNLHTISNLINTTKNQTDNKNQVDIADASTNDSKTYPNNKASNYYNDINANSSKDFNNKNNHNMNNTRQVNYQDLNQILNPINIQSNDTQSNNVFDIPNVESNPSIVTQSASKNKPICFFDRINEQISKLFEVYPQEQILNNLLPDTRWVKIDYDNTGKYYCIGLIGSRPDYICYAVPSIYTPSPPLELDGYCQWLPTNEFDPKSKGYWLIYQDAYTGESVES